MKMNSVVHFELPAEDRKRISKFYEEAFGWKTEQLGEEYGNYVMAMTTPSTKKGPKKSGAINGGFYEKEVNSSPYPSVVIDVDDVDKHVKIVENAGGKIIVGPMDIPNVGRIVSFLDTEGNRLSMMQSEMSG